MEFFYLQIGKKAEDLEFICKYQKTKSLIKEKNMLHHNQTCADDNLKKDGSVPEDKFVAVSVAALRCAVSAGPERNTSKSECRWLASRWQLGDCFIG